MLPKNPSSVRRPPAVAVSGNAAPPVSRPIRLSTATTTHRKTTSASLPGSAKKGATPLRHSPAPKKPASARAPSSGTAGGKGKGKAAETAAATGEHGRHHHANNAPPPPPSDPLSHLSGADTTPTAAGAHSLFAASPAMSYSPTVATTTAHRSLQAASTVGAVSVDAATSAVTGQRYEPTAYKAGFSLTGDYTCIAAVPQSAALWLGNKISGGIDVYSSTTGQLMASLPPRSQIERAKAKERARQQTGYKGRAGRDRVQEVMFPSTSPTSTGEQRALDSVMPTGGVAAQPVVKLTALCASPTHVWAGYENGNVAVYDHLVLTFVAEGNFHNGSPVCKFAVLDDGTVVSASEDGVLVHWDVEDKNFEAIAALPAPGSTDNWGSPNSRDGALTAVVALPKSSVVLCGFHSGHLYAVDVLVAARHLNAGAVGSYKPAVLPLHEARVNALAVLGDMLFSASEEGTVCCTKLQFTLTPKQCSDEANVGTVVASYGIAATSSDPAKVQPKNVSWRLLKRIQTSLPVRGLLTDQHTFSVYVAYADGLVERWSGNPDDDFGVEEVIREGMKIASDTVDGDEDGSNRAGGKKGSATSKKSRSVLPSLLNSRGDSSREVTGLVAINAVETLQVLALSSNGVNKVWYGHHNLLEENISTSINALNAVICEDAHDTAVWRERLSLLKMKENERKGKYVLILEQLTEQKLLLTFYEKWRRRVISNSTGKSKEVVVRELAQRSGYRVLSSYFGKWATFYDAQQKQLRRYTLSDALARANQKTYFVSVFHRWQMHLIQRKMLSSSERCAEVLARASAALVASPCFYKWMRFTQGKTERRDATVALQESDGVNESQIARMERKAQRQTLHRALAHWLDATDQKQCQKVRKETWAQYVDVYARLQDAKKAKSILQGWRRWAGKRVSHTALAAVAELRARQCRIQAQQSAFFRWMQFVHLKHFEAHAAEIKEVEEKLKKAETDSGSDIFEKLQLQKRIDQLIQQQESEDRLFRLDQARLHALQEGRDATLREREEEKQQRAQVRQEDGSLLLPVSQQTTAALPASNPQSSSAAAGTASGSTPPLGIGKGPMASHANYFRHLIDQQRLSPAVLAHMPLPEAVYHVMSQLKGNILNMYTDMGLFRQVKDKRRAGTAAVAIFLESFGEVKRLIVTSLRKGTLKGAGKAARWPLSLQALDSIPAHHCASVLSAIKTMVVAYDLLSPEDAESITGTFEEAVANADWIFLIARACHMRRKPQLPVNNRV